MPELQALLVCDAVAIDPNGKVTLYGVFDLIWAAQVPTRHPQLAIFVKCRVEGPVDLQVLVTDPDGNTMLALDPLRAEVAGIAQGIYSIAALEFRTTGSYRIAVVGPNGPIGFTILEVRVRQ